MPLKLTLKPNEKVLVGSALIANGSTKSEIAILNRVPVVREKDMLAPEDAVTPAQKLYASLVEMYVDPARQAEAYSLYRLMLEQLLDMRPDPTTIDLLSEISSLIKQGDHYRAMRVCKTLILHTEEDTPPEDEDATEGEGEGEGEDVADDPGPTA